MVGLQLERMFCRLIKSSPIMHGFKIHWQEGVPHLESLDPGGCNSHITQISQRQLRSWGQRRVPLVLSGKTLEAGTRHVGSR